MYPMARAQPLARRGTLESSDMDLRPWAAGRVRTGETDKEISAYLVLRKSAPGQPKCSVTDSSNALIPFHAICTPMQTRKNDDNCVITVIPVAPRIRASRSAKP